MTRLLSAALIVSFAVLTWAATPKKAPAKKSSAPAAKSSKSTAKSSAKKSARKSPSKRATTWRNRQAQPTPERYRQIQEALAAKGYLRPEDATGVWGETSTAALKRFQADQNIESTGKINSLSLIALGLGPRRDAVVKPPAPPQ